MLRANKLCYQSGPVTRSSQIESMSYCTDYGVWYLATFGRRSRLARSHRVGRFASGRARGRSGARRTRTRGCRVNDRIRGTARKRELPRRAAILRTAARNRRACLAVERGSGAAGWYDSSGSMARCAAEASYSWMGPPMRSGRPTPDPGSSGPSAPRRPARGRVAL